MVELRAAPDAPIRYTTDGSDPRLSGGSYNGSFVVPPGTLLVLAVAEKNGIVSEQHRLEIRWGTGGPGPGPGPDDEGIDPGQPAIWRREHTTQTTQDTYGLLGRLKKYQAVLPVAKIMVVEKSWAELNLDEKLVLNAEQLEETIGQLRGLVGGGEVSLEAMSIHFPTGQHLRALAITGTDESFRRSMVDSYRNLAEHMPANGLQVVMFTHQDAGVWADLTLILWAAGLRVTAAWCIATETDSALREGNYVQGTVLLVLRKQTSDETAFMGPKQKHVPLGSGC